MSSEIAPLQKISKLLGTTTCDSDMELWNSGTFRNDNVRVNRLVIQTHLFVALPYEVLHA